MNQLKTTMAKGLCLPLVALLALSGCASLLAGPDDRGLGRSGRWCLSGIGSGRQRRVDLVIEHAKRGAQVVIPPVGAQFAVVKVQRCAQALG